MTGTVVKNRPFLIRRKWETAEGILGFELTPEDRLPLDAIDPGAHVECLVERDGQMPLVRHYSLCNAPDETDAYVLGIKKETPSRGGSTHFHGLPVGARVLLGSTCNHFPLVERGAFHLLLAGGIGITPLLSMMQHLSRHSRAYELHYFVRGPSHVAFSDRLETARLDGRLHIHVGLDGDQTRQRLEAVLRPAQAGTHGYCCGPAPFIGTVEHLSAQHWTDGRQMHYERFQADASALARPQSAFTVVARPSGIRCPVGPGESIVGALAKAGVHIDTSCEQGVCGTCLTPVVEGTPDHRDTYLNPAERSSSRYILPCVSRSLTPVLVLDL